MAAALAVSRLLLVSRRGLVFVPRQLLATQAPQEQQPRTSSILDRFRRVIGGSKTTDSSSTSDFPPAKEDKVTVPFQEQPKHWLIKKPKKDIIPPLIADRAGIPDHVRLIYNNLTKDGGGLDNISIKFQLLAQCTKDFQLDITNPDLNRIETVENVISIFEQQFDIRAAGEEPKTVQEALRRRSDLPPNFVVIPSEKVQRLQRMMTHRRKSKKYEKLKLAAKQAAAV